MAVALGLALTAPTRSRATAGLAAVVHRELVANADGFAAFEAPTAELLPAALTRLRLHDVIRPSSTLRRPYAVQLGRAGRRGSGWVTVDRPGSP